MIEQAYAPRDSRLTDLSIIGVPAEYHDHLPTLQGFPRKFSREGLAVWKIVLDKIKSGNLFVSMASRDLVWHFTIQAYLQECEDLGVYPFVAGNTDTTRNEYITSFVRRGRMQIVKYATDAGLFKNIKVRWTHREYVRVKGGLIIRSWADMQPVQDTKFREWLVSTPLPRFQRSTHSTYKRLVRPNVNMWVRYLSATRVTVGYSIKVIGTLNIPGNKTPTREQVNKFIDDTIFLPVIRAHRFPDISRTRLF
jgi:hypothetical protein